MTTSATVVEVTKSGDLKVSGYGTLQMARDHLKGTKGKQALILHIVMSDVDEFTQEVLMKEDL